MATETSTHVVSSDFTAQVAEQNSNPNAPRTHTFRRGEQVQVMERRDRFRRPYYVTYVYGFPYSVPANYFNPVTYSAGNYISIQDLANRLCQVQIDYNNRKASGNFSNSSQFDETISLLRNMLYSLGFDAINCGNVVNYGGLATLAFRSLDPSQMAQTICQIKSYISKYGVTGADADTLNSISASIRASISNLGYTLNETNCIVAAPPVTLLPYYNRGVYYRGRRRSNGFNF